MLCSAEAPAQILTEGNSVTVVVVGKLDDSTLDYLLQRLNVYYVERAELDVFFP